METLLASFERLSLEVTALAELWEEGAAELQEEHARLERDLEALEAELLFPTDGPRAALVTLTAGAGGTEAADWCARLARTYLQFSDELGLKAQLLEAKEHAASRAGGMDEVTLRVHGPNAYAWLRGENGVHRLTRVSPYDAKARKHTTFTAVRVTPEVEAERELVVDAGEVRVEVFRARGPGGQGVNTTDSAVRLTYKQGTPEELSVNSQASRSQVENRELAWKALRARLLEWEAQRAQAATQQRWASQEAAAWGSQVRSYKLDRGYVVDHRTGARSSDPEAVLGGELREFALAFLRLERVDGAPWAS